MRGKKPIESAQPLSDDELDAAVGGVVDAPHPQTGAGSGTGSTAW